MVTCSTLLSMILLLRSSRSFSRSVIFRSISSSSASTSVILTASASPSLTIPLWRLSTWINTLIIILFPDCKSTNDLSALSTFLCTSKLHDYGDLSSALWEIFMDWTLFVLTFRMQEIFLCLSKVSIRVASWSRIKSDDDVVSMTWMGNQELHRVIQYFFWLSISSPARRCSRYHLLVTTATARELRPLWPHPGLGPEPELKLAGEDMMSRVTCHMMSRVTLHCYLCHVDQSFYSCWQRSARVNYTWHSDHSEPNLWSGRRSLAVTTAPPSSEI